MVIFTDRFKVVLLLWIFFVIYVSRLSLLCCLVYSLQPCITCWERADLLVLLCVMFSCVLSLSHMVYPVRRGTWLYLFLIFAFFNRKWNPNMYKWNFKSSCKKWNKFWWPFRQFPVTGAIPVHLGAFRSISVINSTVKFRQNFWLVESVFLL